MHAASIENAAEAFVELGILIVEGRVPCPGTSRGYMEGPHCLSPMRHLSSCHSCNIKNSLFCDRVENFRKHMTLLCDNAVPMCIEVFLCASCQCGKSRSKSADVAVTPSSTDLLLEQWTISFVANRGKPAAMNIRGLLQAVRSQLHFSQLSAWWSASEGLAPENVCYRLTMPGQTFSSQFHRTPLEHSFPSAGVSSIYDIQVLVRTLPRCDTVPVIICPIHSDKSEFPNATRKRSVSSVEQPNLGESLLDPPNPRPPDRLFNLSSTGIDWLTFPTYNRWIRKPASSNELSKDLDLVDDRMHTSCDKAGKHRCSCGEEELEITTEPLTRQRRRSQMTNLSNVIDSTISQSSIDDVHGPEMQENLPRSRKRLNFELSHQEVNQVLKVLRVRFPSVRNEVKINNSATKCDEQLFSITSSSIVGFVGENKNICDSKPFAPTTTFDRTIYDEKCKPTRLDSKSFCYNKNHNCDTQKLLSVNSKKISPSFFCDNMRTTRDDSESQSPLSDSSFNAYELWSEFRKNDVVDKTRSALCSIVDRFRTKTCMVKQEIHAENKENEDVRCEITKEYPLEPKNVSDVKDKDISKEVHKAAGGVARSIPSAVDKAKFRRSLDSAASMVFHWRTGLPLTSSPAPLRRVSHRFDFDSSINCVSAIRSALFDPPDEGCTANCNEILQNDNSSSNKSLLHSPATTVTSDLFNFFPHPSCSALLGSFEESVLNGRLEPVSTVQGFSADLGASGSFCPRHVKLPVTVFFYTVCDNDKVSSPYMGHINLGKKGYTIPRCGTVQVTLLNPLGTVIKMFVIMYDLSDMPPYSCTFLRQRTYYMPTDEFKEPEESAQKYLRYLIHLRFISSKSGRISLHSDIRIIVFRKSDLDTATGHKLDAAYELRSFTRGPNNPKFSPRK